MKVISVKEFKAKCLHPLDIVSSTDGNLCHFQAEQAVAVASRQREIQE